MYIAVDDTDSVDGGCTTYLATAIIDELADLDMIGYPRLVRLNPAIPWKTRGNGALVMRFGEGRGAEDSAGCIAGRGITCFTRCSGQEPEAEALLQRIIPLIGEHSEPGAEPGLLVSAVKPAQRFYWGGVRSVIGREAAEAEIRRIGASCFTAGGGRGIIGCVCAMAWRPRDRTYELLTYRPRDRWGTGRIYDVDSIRRAQSEVGTSFNSWDEHEQRVAMVPATPCPVMYGFRGDDPGDLLRGSGIISTEPVDRWMLFLTNQGTDDHVVRDPASLEPGGSYSLDGTVVAKAVHLRGGHVLIDIATRHGTVVCAAYEPSKGFRQAVSRLRAGDKVTVIGEYRDVPRTLNLEKFRVIELAEDPEKVSNPVCGGCGRTMKSRGRDAGFRCARCRTSADAPVIKNVPRELAVGWYEPPADARRHLSKPLCRMGERQPVFFVDGRS